jgi:hypothetical protein
MATLTHPLQQWPRSHRGRVLAILAVVTVLPIALDALVHPLHDDKPGGASIVDFEKARTVDRADEILATWRSEGVLDDAKRIQLLDFIYPLIYAAALAMACLAAASAWARAGLRGIAGLAVVMAWVATAAAVFDYIENLGLDISLWNVPTSPWPQISFVAAELKFAAIYTTLAYVLLGLIASVVLGRRRAVA